MEPLTDAVCQAAKWLESSWKGCSRKSVYRSLLKRAALPFEQLGTNLRRPIGNV
jgi:hypothetical protein